MTQQFIDILNRVNPEILEYNGHDLVHDGILDSLDVMNLVAELEQAFSIEFDPDDVIPENFAAAQTIWALVEKLQA